MPRRNLLRLMLALVWLTAVHHCAFEGLGYSLFKPADAQSLATAPSANCPAHSNQDSAAHKEGRPCDGSIAVQQASADVSAPLPIFYPSVFGDLAAIELEESRSRSVPNRPSGPDTHVALVILLLSDPLLLAPNAPPLSA